MNYRHNGGPALTTPEGYDKVGWIAIHRSIRDHWLVGFGKAVPPADPSRGAHSHYEAFSDLIMNCRYDSGTVLNNGKKMKLAPGQLLGGVSWLADRWNWLPKKVRWFLDKLEEDEMISRSRADETGALGETFKGNRHGNQRQVITLCNYLEYQVAKKSSGNHDGNRGAINSAINRATERAITVDDEVIDYNGEIGVQCTDEGNHEGNQKGSHKGRDLKEKVKEIHTTRVHTHAREEARLEEASPQTQMVDEDGSFYGQAIELTPEEHASWRARFEALSGTWPTPLLVADEFLGREFDRQGIRDARDRKTRVMAYLAKRNTEAAMLQSQVTATAIVKPTPRGNGYANGSRAPATDWASAVKAAVAKRKGLPQ